MRILVTGGAGFIGSHLCDKLIENGNDIICVDNFFTGTKDKLAIETFIPSFLSVDWAFKVKKSIRMRNIMLTLLVLFITNLQLFMLFWLKTLMKKLMQQSG